MRIRTSMFSTLSVAAMLATSCAESPASCTSPETSDPANAGGETASRSDDDDGATVVCHLDCSGTEASASGATEEEARANLRPYIEPNCRPEDGQYFIFCDPPR